MKVSCPSILIPSYDAYYLDYFNYEALEINHLLNFQYFTTFPPLLGIDFYFYLQSLNKLVHSS